MPKLPSYETIIAKPTPKDLCPKIKKKMQEEQRVIFKKVREVLDNKAAMEEILLEFPKTEEHSAFEAKEGRAKRIDSVLRRAGLIGEEGKKRYRDALAQSFAG